MNETVEIPQPILNLAKEVRDLVVRLGFMADVKSGYVIQRKAAEMRLLRHLDAAYHPAYATAGKPVYMSEYTFTTKDDGLHLMFKPVVGVPMADTLFPSPIYFVHIGTDHEVNVEVGYQPAGGGWPA